MFVCLKLNELLPLQLRIYFLITRYFWEGQIKEDVMGEISITCGREDEYIQSFEKKT
jgi:hypothetical protein